VRALVLGAVSVSTAGCGSARAQRHRTTTTAARRKAASAPRLRTAPGTLTVPAPPPSGIRANPAAVAVIRGWADALRHGDVAAAARYFAVPSVMINGVVAGGQVDVFRIHTRAQAREANETLPCGAKLISTDMRGQYVNALFALTGRPGPGGSNCGGGAGTTARTNFVIAHGRIVAWVRAPSDPGDNGSGSPGPVA
jgi:hypothetical protein